MNIKILSILFSCISFGALAQSSTQSNDSTANLGNEDSVKVSTLEEFTVEAAPITTADGNLLFNPSTSAVESSRYAIDMLSKLGIPGLHYDIVSRSVTCNNSAPVILIDGIPSSQEELKNIKPSEVLNVEYSSFVPVKYSRYGNGSMLNIRLKRKQNGGRWNLNNWNDFKGKSEDANTGLFFYQGASRLNLLGSFSFRDNKKTYDEYTTEYTNPNLPVTSFEKDYSPFNYRSGFTYLQYSYAPSPSLLFTAKYTFNISNSHRYSNGEIEDTQNGQYSYKRKYRDNTPSHEVDLYFSKDLGSKNSIDVNILYSNNISDVTNHQSFSGESIDDVIPYSIHSRRNSLLGAVDYGHKFSNKARFDVYYSFTVSDNVNDYKERETIFSSKELNHLAYLQFQGGLWKNAWLSAKTGLKADRVTENSRPRTLINNMSELSLQWQLNSNWIFWYNGSFNSSSLPLSTYDATLVQSNPFLYNCGNPDIHASSALSNGVQLMYSRNHWTLSLGLSNNHIFNPIFNIPEYNPTLEAYLQRPENGRKADSYTVRLQASIPQIFKMFSFFGYLTYHRGENTLANGWKLTHNGLGGYLQLGWTYKKWSAYYFKNFPQKALSNLTITNVMENSDGLGLTYNLTDNLNFTLSWMYIFSKKGWIHEQNKETPDYRTHVYREIHENINWIRLNIGYNIRFGSPFKANDKKRTLQIKDTQKTFDDYSN